MNEIYKKLEELKKLLEEYSQVVIAFSGGVDSTFLTKIAFDTLTEKATAITIASPQLPKHELDEAKEIANEIGIKHFIIDGSNADISWFQDNPPDRCYICKKGTIATIRKFCEGNQIEGELLEGSNFDDLDDYRPGFKAVQEEKVRSPLIEAKLTKDEIRFLLKELKFSCWDKPASPCLATRFFFGEKITEEKLMHVYNAENFLKSYGIIQVRVRVHGQIARIETTQDYFDIIMKNSQDISVKLKEIGYQFVTLDLAGYKKGSMNKPRS